MTILSLLLTADHKHNIAAMQLSLDHRTDVVAAAKLIVEHNNLCQKKCQSSARLLGEMPQMSKMVQVLELLQVWELLPIRRLLRCRPCTWMRAQSRSIIAGRSRSVLKPSTGLLQQCGFIEDTPNPYSQKPLRSW
jgi:hypothetical protein